MKRAVVYGYFTGENYGDQPGPVGAGQAGMGVALGRPMAAVDRTGRPNPSGARRNLKIMIGKDWVQ
jgi:hypothetical protein